MSRATIAETASFRRRRWVYLAATVALPAWLAAVLYVDHETALFPKEQPERGHAILIAFFAGVLVTAIVQMLAWRCPACSRWMSTVAFFLKRCPKCDAEFR